MPPVRGPASWRSPKSTADLLVPQLESFVRYTPGLHSLRSAVQRLRERHLEKSTDIVEAEAMGQSVLPPEIFYTKMPRHIGTAASRAMWNFSLGTVFGPILLVTIAGKSIASGNPASIGRGMLEAVVVSTIWTGLGYGGALAQLLGGAFYTVSGPYWIYGARRTWHPVHREWVKPTMEPDAELNMMPTDGELWEEAMARMARQRDGPSGDLPSRGREYYSVLGITETATQTDIKKAYRRASMVLHPDRNPSPNAQAEFEQLTKAYKVLSDPTARKKYDAGGEEALKSGAGGEVDRRDTLRSLFGGDVLRDLCGEVRSTRFFRRIIDKVSYSVQEVAILNARSADRAAETLLKYIDGHPGPAPTAEPGKPSTEYDRQLRTWEQGLKRRTNAYINTGIAKEVLHVLGEEYHRVLDEDDMSAVQRTVNGMLGTPRRVADRVAPWVHIARNGTRANRDPGVVMETVWGLSVIELRYTARYAAQKVALDVSATEEERTRRKAALRSLARAFVKAGKPWDGVSDSVMNTISRSAAEDMRRRAREREDRK